MTRHYRTPREYDALLEAQGGRSCVKGCEEAKGLIAEHSTPNPLKPGPDQLMGVPCHNVKTLRDVQAIAKAKRLDGTTMTRHERLKKFGSLLRGFEKRDWLVAILARHLLTH